MAKLIRALLLAGGLVWMVTGLAAAQTSTMSAEEVDALVAKITRSVLAELGKPPPAAALPGDEPAAVASTAAPVGLNAADAVLARVRAVALALPEFSRSTAAGFARLDATAQGGKSTLGFLVRLALVLAAALVVEFGIRLALRPLRQKVAAHLNTTAPLGYLLALLLVEAVAVAGLWAVLRGAGNQAAPANDAQGQFLTLGLTLLLAWRTYLLPVRAWLRPEMPVARIAPLDDAGATAVYRRIAAVLLIILSIKMLCVSLLASTTAPDAIAAGGLLANVVIVTSALYAIVRSRAAVATWFVSMVPPHGLAHGLKAAVALHWWWFGVALFAVFSGAQARGVLMGRFDVAGGIELTLTLILALIFFETLLDYLSRRQAADGTDTVTDVVTRSIAVAVRVLFALVVAQTWAVDVLGMMTAAEWNVLRRGVTTAGIALYGGYVLWQIVRYQIDRYIALNPIASTFGEPDEDSKPPTTGSRLRTLMPVFRATLAVTIFVLTLLIVLSELGVNTAPLIAGASVFGLAISFGSQALVRDVVSGIFYLADDAFRVGEYIDTGKVKGTVEGFTLRSLRLRHQNGQVHTMPFGQLGSITNFSRDWTTVKFNLRVARGTDIELVRKTVKKIGLQLAEEPEYKDEFLEPLKLQGIADVIDNALVLRFKFTVRPINPSLIQRQAVKRIYLAFAEKGIEFAQSTVSINTLGGPPPDPATLAAAVAQSQQRPASETGS